MRNVLTLFKGDLKRLFSNVMTIVIAIGLVALPSIFSWYNILACQNVFDNTGELKVAVANDDEGYKSDLVPIRINIGEQVVSALRSNDQLGWVITTTDDAIDGARSGRYYAAVVIPESFSADMMSFASDTAEHATITYYSNQKKSAIAPKLTSQGADSLAAQVNKTFTETISEVALGITSTLVDYASENDLGGVVGKVNKRIDSASEQLESMSGVLDSYARLVGAGAKIVDDSGALLGEVRTSANETSTRVKQIGNETASVADAATQAAGALSIALDTSSSGYDDLALALENSFDKADALDADAASALRGQVANVDSLINSYTELSKLLEQLQEKLPDDAQPAVQAAAGKIDAAVDSQTKLRDALEDAADDINAGTLDSQTARKRALQLVDEAAKALGNARGSFDETLEPKLEQFSSSLIDADATLGYVTGKLDAAAADLSGRGESAAASLDAAQLKLENAADKMREASKELDQLNSRIAKALAAGDESALRSLLAEDPALLASALAAPVAMERHAVYPVADFGSAMSPLYTTLALWIGSLLIMVALKPTPSRRNLAELDDPHPWQLFTGRFCIVALLSLAQSSILALGNIFFLQLQIENPLLYLVCFWVAGLVFAFIMYALVASFGNLGKALGVVLLIVQVSGGGGAFPLQLLPAFFQKLSPYLPITHSVNAMRAAMFGIYQGDYWISLVTLIAFTIPLLVLGFALRKPLMRVVDRFMEKAERSKMM